MTLFGWALVIFWAIALIGNVVSLAKEDTEVGTSGVLVTRSLMLSLLIIGILTVGTGTGI